MNYAIEITNTVSSMQHTTTGTVREQYESAVNYLRRTAYLVTSAMRMKALRQHGYSEDIIRAAERTMTLRERENVSAYQGITRRVRGTITSRKRAEFEEELKLMYRSRAGVLPTSLRRLGDYVCLVLNEASRISVHPECIIIKGASMPVHHIWRDDMGYWIVRHNIGCLTRGWKRKRPVKMYSDRVQYTEYTIVVQ